MKHGESLGEEMSENPTTAIRINLEGEVAKRFLEIKKKYGQRTQAETIRLIITRYYDMLRKQDE